MVLGLVQGLGQVLDFFGVSMLHSNGREGVIHHEFTTNRKNHLPWRFIKGMWLAGPVLTIRGMVSSVNLATLKVIEEEKAVMGGCVGGERRVHMPSDNDRKKNGKEKWSTVTLHSRVRRHKMFVPSTYLTESCIVKLKARL